MIEVIKKEWSAKITFLFFTLITIWWIEIFLSGKIETSENYFFGATYGLICIVGGISGLIAARKWGGTTSAIGKSLIVLSFGLFAQEFGQLVFSYYNIFLNVEIPYPSIADIGFFGTIPFYIYGISLLAKASGAKFSLNTLSNQIQAFLIPLGMLTLSYIFFLRSYEADFSNPLQVFLDFGYPLGEAIYISLAILTYSLSVKLLGGIMRSKVLFIVAAFVMQYIAEFNFLYQNSVGTWINAGYGDFLYLLSYTVMTLGLIQFNTAANNLNKE